MENERKVKNNEIEIEEVNVYVIHIYPIPYIVLI